jgi:mannonate dehydratase
MPTAQAVGIRMGIHPDDPPRPLLGRPRIGNTADDLAFIVEAHPFDANGITFCTGSLEAGRDNDVPAMAKRFARHIHFAHLHNVAKEPDGSFMEADHLGGDVDMVSVVTTLLEEQKRRLDAGDGHWRLPFRFDHGHELLDDIGKPTHPGYPAIGRLRGRAEIRGIMTAVTSLRELPV